MKNSHRPMLYALLLAASMIFVNGSDTYAKNSRHTSKKRGVSKITKKHRTSKYHFNKLSTEVSNLQNIVKQSIEETKKSQIAAEQRFQSEILYLRSEINNSFKREHELGSTVKYHQYYIMGLTSVLFMLSTFVFLLWQKGLLKVKELRLLVNEYAREITLVTSIKLEEVTRTISAVNHIRAVAPANNSIPKLYAVHNVYSIKDGKNIYTNSRPRTKGQTVFFPTSDSANSEPLIETLHNTGPLIIPASFVKIDKTTGRLVA